MSFAVLHYIYLYTVAIGEHRHPSYMCVLSYHDSPVSLIDKSQVFNASVLKTW